MGWKRKKSKETGVRRGFGEINTFQSTTPHLFQPPKAYILFWEHILKRDHIKMKQALIKELPFCSVVRD